MPHAYVPHVQISISIYNFTINISIDILIDSSGLIDMKRHAEE